MADNTIKLRRLGNSDLMVSPVGLGCWQFSRRKGLAGKYWPMLSDEEIQGIVDSSLGLGVNWFDTAESYGSGESEKALASSLRNAGRTSEDVFVATKWMPFFRRASSIRNTISIRLENLAGYRIDLHQIHNPLYLSSTKSVMDAMAGLVKEGSIRFIGVSNFTKKRMLAAQGYLNDHGLELVSNQVVYSLLNRKIETKGVLDAAIEKGIAIIAYSPIAQGILSGKYHEDPGLIHRKPGFRRYLPLFQKRSLEKSRPLIEALKEIAERHGAYPAQIALSWVIHFQGEYVVAIPGATHVKQAEDNARAMQIRLTNDEMDHLDLLSRPFR